MVYFTHVWLIEWIAAAAMALKAPSLGSGRPPDGLDDSEPDLREDCAAGEFEPSALNLLQVKAQLYANVSLHAGGAPVSTATVHTGAAPARRAGAPRTRRGTFQVRGKARTWRERTDYSVPPEIEIDLDLRPEDRFAGMVEYYRELLPSMCKTFKDEIDSTFTAEEQAEWLDWSESATSSSELVAEIQGMVDLIDDPSCTMDTVKLWGWLYEMGSPTATACSGVLAAMPNGTVVHGRNMDYWFLFKSPKGETLNWPNVTYNAIFTKGGVPIMKSTQWPMHVISSSILRYADETGKGWTFEQNTRPGNNAALNLAAAKQGGQAFGEVVRNIAMQTADFHTALSRCMARSTWHRSTSSWRVEALTRGP
jgi:hypothetical protein